LTGCTKNKIIMRIISVSRRTDIPAFYGDWLMNRIAAGYAGYINPFNGAKYIVSLKRDDVASIVLWSKNFTQFLNNAMLLSENGYSLFFNYTITGLPEIFEPEAPSAGESIESIKYLSGRFSPDHINWRYDPILISDITGQEYHLNRFETLCKTLSGFVKRCYISFPTDYGKVEKSFKYFSERTEISIHGFSPASRIELAENLSIIAEKYGIALYSCCGDYLTGNRIKKGRCIDGKILSAISGTDLSKIKSRPTRKECGCTESADIGIYDSCPHGCVYCYANSNTARASDFYNKYRSDESYSTSSFLGMTKEVSDSFDKEILTRPESSGIEYSPQPLLF